LIGGGATGAGTVRFGGLNLLVGWHKNYLAGRVGQRATVDATHCPLVEPDVRISRIRLS
jgi:hypothetical protein